MPQLNKIEILYGTWLLKSYEAFTCPTDGQIIDFGEQFVGFSTVRVVIVRRDFESGIVKVHVRPNN